MARLFERATIAGVGLIGGSLALAAKRAGLVGEVVGLGRGRANLELACERGILDRYSHDPIEAVRGADLVVLAAPVRALGPLARACAAGLRADAVVTDAGSVKQSVVQSVEAALPDGVAFVGAHPIAGGEQAGAQYADADLFRGARCVLTPSARSTPSAVAKVQALWEGVGMRVSSMDATRHDAILARVSHLPHVLAFALVNAVAAADAEAGDYAGASFNDLTRIAASPVEVWRDIFFANRDAVTQSVVEVRRALDAFEAALAAGDETRLEQWIEAARQQKARWANEPDA